MTTYVTPEQDPTYTTTAIAIATSQPVSDLAVMLPGLNIPVEMSLAEREEVLYFIQEYMAADCLEVETILTTTKRRAGEKPVEDRVYMDVWGVLCHRVRLTDQVTGETFFRVRTVFKVLLDGQDDFSYVGFVSETIFRDVQQFLALNIRPMGEWSDPLTMIVKTVAAKLGRTYKFQFVRRP